ncbi:hypothetical protein LA366_02525 [Aeromonas jandaei]|uniref:Uncharacterized protein n=1 Tax=Aeromonas jandaei TaxID=650 RepID=A0A7T4DPE4_AERJA|nr:hypothetical protein [Aeromonas jandaei]QQB19309.1 hypothetical protein I6H43_17580 [Aeromonas jandaei]UCA33983.1 hypothetical protein LA366_02525 [Aeromonas jandaei]
MTIQARPPRPEAKPVTDRENIILKAVIHELSLELDTALIPTAHAAGTDKTALRLSRELMARKIERAEKQPSA